MAYRYGLPSDEHLRAIGMVTAQWERLRSIVDVGISALSEQQFQEGEETIPYKDLRQRLDILLEKYRHQDGDEAANRELNGICSLIYDRLREERNEVVHGLWILGDFDTAYRITIRARDGEPIKKASQRNLSLISVADDIAEGADRLIKFLHDHNVTEIEMETARGR